MLGCKRSFWSLAFVVAGVVAVVGAAGIARADTVVADWQFNSAETLLDDSSGNGNTLAQFTTGGVTWSSDHPTGVGSGSAYFDGIAGNGLITAAKLDLSSYRNVYMDWYRFDSDTVTSTTIMAEHGNLTASGNFLAASEGGVQSEAGIWGPSGQSVYDVASRTTGAWEHWRAEFNLDASSNSDAVKLWKGGVLQNDWYYEALPATFLNDYFSLGAGTGGGDHPMTGNLANFTVGTIPEPSSAILVAISLLGLVAYAWRKRR